MQRYNRANGRELMDTERKLMDTGRKEENIILLLTPKATVAFLYDHCSLRQGLEKMRYHGYTAIPVITKDGTYIGTVSEGDFLWHLLDSDVYTMKLQEEYSILDILRKGWNLAVKIDTIMNELLLRVMDQNFVPVIDDRGKFMGIITRKDVIKYYYNLMKTNKT
ncbi:MAG TPA: CBS domain-containing protein [Methylomusa anaerophila]|uniref:CBS domain protein n=1 Tax=Methylomusa anaerophila TaxID=1930071 RepID=A0A348AIJ8_9FIRM|nr:CBS domain-containing protein [Methylomusa anaerophila]BBB90896.1 CBS domain protein [Methylomusa anaerophila]HML90615.1 CBS domain-containing protein [Methylomusa anaerophila]